MGILKKLVLGLITVFILAIFGLWITGNAFILTGIARTYLVGHPTANIDDHQQFKTNTITTSTPQAWPEIESFKADALPQDFLDHLEQNDAIAFLVARNGEIVTESYFDGYTDRSKTNSFSMAKTVITLLMGIAIDEGYIESVDQALTDFLPEFANDEFGKNASIGSLSTMSSGYDWDESYYNPFSPTVKLYYGPDVIDFLTKGHFSKEVDSYFYYSSASTQLLSIAVKRALQAQDPDITLSEYLSEKIWEPLGMNDDALWHLDNNGMELAYCCISTNARNFAKLGQLMLQNGAWNNDTLLSSSYVTMMHQPIFVNNYGYSTWLGKDAEEPYYYFRGHLGQYIIVVPGQDMVIVRLGKTPGSGVVEDNIDEFIRQAKAL
ncbi:MAG: CubicO group peptidase (beta-lactamase class C family) [Chitinophagales bacterium]|jgi:CubicO group peptidase (beta-lactamase class C family)